MPITLSNLTHLSILVYDAKFNEFEMFITKIDSKLKMLSFITYSEDIDYLDANRWEKLIMKYFPQLKEFYFQYDESLDFENKSTIYLGQPNEFASSFWIE